MGKNFEAAKEKKGILLSFIPTGEYYYSKGIKAYRRKDYELAKKYLQRAVDLEPNEPMIVFQLALVYMELGMYKESNKLLHLIIEELDEHMVECHYFLANNYAFLGYFKDAYQHAVRYLDMDEDGDFADDTKDLIDFIMLEGDDIEEEELISRQEEAREYLEAGEFQEAISLLKNVIADFPEFWSAYNNLALAHYYLGDEEKADRILDEVLEKNPGNLHALCNKLVFAFYNKDIPAIRTLKQALQKITPLHADHQFKLGATFALVGDYKYAYFWLKKLLKRGYEGNEAFYYWLATSAYYNGNYKTAENCWKMLVKLSPEKEGQEPWKKEE